MWSCSWAMSLCCLCPCGEPVNVGEVLLVQLTVLSVLPCPHGAQSSLLWLQLLVQSPVTTFELSLLFLVLLFLGSVPSCACLLHLLACLVLKGESVSHAKSVFNPAVCEASSTCFQFELPSDKDMVGHPSTLLAASSLSTWLRLGQTPHFAFWHLQCVCRNRQTETQHTCFRVKTVLEKHLLLSCCRDTGGSTRTKFIR